MLLQQQRRRAGDVRRRHRRAGEDRERRAGGRGGVDESTSRPGAEMSGFRKWPKSVGPADEKLVITPLRFVCSSRMSAVTRIDACPPFAAA